MSAHSLSVIIPVINEGGSLLRTLESAKTDQEAEIIVVDGGSSDDSAAIAQRAGARVIKAERGRARQLNQGAQSACGDILLFLHGDTELPRGYGALVRASMENPAIAAGAFSLAIDSASKQLRCIALLANLRSRLLQLPYGDQAIFVRSALFWEVGGYAQIPIMEDFQLIRMLHRKGRIVTLPSAVLTSARRWRKLGALRTTLINQLVLSGFLLGISPARLAAFYRGVQKR